MVNGVPIYPPGPRSGMGLRAKQITSDKDIKTFRQGIPLSTSVEVQGVKAVAGSDGVMKIHSISIDIIGLASHVVRLDTVRVLIAEGTGKSVRYPHILFTMQSLTKPQPMLLPIETTPYQSNPIQDSCTNIFCRFRAIIAAKISALRAAAAARLNKFRGCGRPGSIKDNGATRVLPGHRRPHLQGLGTQNATHHRFRHAVRRFIRVVVLPIFFGITSGLVIGAFSMLVWTAVASAVRRMSGSKPPSYEELAQAEEGERAGGEVECEGPPKYEEVYTEPEEDVFDEKKQLL